jgi:hypothetical protein
LSATSAALLHFRQYLQFNARFRQKDNRPTDRTLMQSQYGE